MASAMAAQRSSTLRAAAFLSRFGYGLAALLVGLFDSDLYRLPLIVQPSTYGYAVLVIAVAAAATGVAVARRIAGLDLIAVLKTRE